MSVKIMDEKMILINLWIVLGWLMCLIIILRF